MSNIENTVVHNLLSNEEYVQKVLPFLKPEYFVDQNNQVLFAEINDFVTKYNKIPTTAALKVHVEQRSDLNDEQYQTIQDTIDAIDGQDKPTDDLTWLTEQTEAWCQERAVYNAIMNSIQIMDGQDKTKSRLIIPELLNDALSVNFDTRIGHDYFRDAATRFEFYRKKETKIEFDIELLNIITNGGVTRKTLNMFIAGTNVGKSAVLCHLTAAFASQGLSVLYVTLEMSEEEVGRRIDANLMNINSELVETLERKRFLTNIKDIYKKTGGQVIIREFPGGGSTHAGHIRHLIRELKLKKKFTPDVLIVDYLGIMGSARYKTGGNVNVSYYLKSVAEELRGLGQEFNIPVFSAAQFNREGMTSSEGELANIAESIGITHTADLAIGMTRTEQLDQLGQVMFKQLKNRYNSLINYRKFVIGVDYAKSRFYNLSESAQSGLIQDSGSGEEDKPLMDNKFGPEKKGSKKRTVDFEGFKLQ